MNREFKRMMKKQETSADRLRRPREKKKRTKPRVFVKEVRGELGKVAWPTRQEVFTYTLVVIVTVAFFMLIISGIDYVSLKGIVWLLDKGGN